MYDTGVRWWRCGGGWDVRVSIKRGLVSPLGVMLEGEQKKFYESMSSIYTPPIYL